MIVQTRVELGMRCHGMGVHDILWGAPGSQASQPQSMQPIRAGTPQNVTLSDQPQALTGTEPAIASLLPLGTDVLRLNLWIEQSHGGIEMREVCSLLRKVLLKLPHYWPERTKRAGATVTRTKWERTEGTS